MKIAIIGTGHVGSAIAHGLARKGHTVILGARNPGAEGVTRLAAETGATTMLPRAAAEAAEVILLALPWAAATAAIADLGPLPGKVVIDCMNPLGVVDGALGLMIGHTTSGAEVVQSLLPQARVVKTLNQVGAEIMARNAQLPHRPVQFIAGNDGAAKVVVADLLRDLGFDPLDAGDLTKARLLEPFAMVWINQALLRGKGRDWAFVAVTASQA